MRSLIAAIAILAAGPAAAADLPVQLADGAQWTQTITRSRTTDRDGKVTSGGAVTVLRATYRENGKGPATLTQELVSIQAQDGAGPQLDMAERLGGLIYPVTVEVDEALTPTRVRDWEKVRAALVEAVAGATQEPKAREFAAGFVGRFDDTTAVSLFRELAMVSLGQGTALQPGEPVPYEDRLPNPFGGPPIASTGTFTLVSADARKAVIDWKQSLDPKSTAESLQAAMAGMLEQAAPEKAAEFKAQMSGLRLVRNDVCRYEIDVATGLAARTDCTMILDGHVMGQTAKRTDHWVIEQSLPEVR